MSSAIWRPWEDYTTKEEIKFETNSFRRSAITCFELLRLLLLCKLISKKYSALIETTKALKLAKRAIEMIILRGEIKINGR